MNFQDINTEALNDVLTYKVKINEYTQEEVDSIKLFALEEVDDFNSKLYSLLDIEYLIDSVSDEAIEYLGWDE